ncbi:homoserine kinase [Peribacillus frigoritolerans]|uniref:homoserine kinase n=1 Tax=Peribacillus frigoritolerans TaxID=450367 RepID=UPI001059F940|nr:homoserine kinase [Peribacillus frigoritolerans]TDL76180.1 homoserine kinase [Peribacillus frigoritolerans]
MAVKTNFSSNNFKNILSNYNLGELVYSNPITKGTVQTNFFIKTTTNKLVFRYYENRTTESVLFEINLINYLQEKKYPCPTPLCNNYGHFIGIYNDKPYVVFSFIEGEHIDNPTNNQKKQLIEKVAELHNITKGYKSDLTQYRLNYNVEQCEKLAQESAEKINTLNSQEKLKWYRYQLNQLVLPSSLPKGICHCDFHISNILYHHDEFKALIDFDDANYTFLTFDLMCMLEPFKTTFDWDTWDKFSLEDDVFDFSNAKTVVLEYSKCRPLNESEKIHLFDLLKFGILIDCIWYFERGDVKDFFEKRKIDYLDNLGRENFYKKLFG